MRRRVRYSPSFFSRTSYHQELRVSFCSVSSKIMLKTLGNISLVFLGLMTGLVRCEISSCYKVGPAPEYSRMFYSSHSEVDQSWINSTVLDVLTSVPNYEECQLLCQVRKTTFAPISKLTVSWRTLRGVWGGPGLTRRTRTLLLTVFSSLTSEIELTTRTVSGRS